MTITEIQFTTHVFKEGGMYVAYTPELDLSSCGRTETKASKNLKEAVRLFLEEAQNLGTLADILQEAGYKQRKHRLASPKLVATRRVTIPVSLAYAKN